VFEVELPP